MRRATGWSVLAITALELLALALFSRLFAAGSLRPMRAGSRSDAARGYSGPEQAPPRAPAPLEFLMEIADDRARYYRAFDQYGQVLTGFYSDGRVRVADSDHRLAGIVEGGRAHLLDVSNDTWSELFVRETPAGALALEMRDGPYDARIFACEPLSDLPEARKNP